MDNISLNDYVITTQQSSSGMIERNEIIGFMFCAMCDIVHEENPVCQMSME